ncbi:protein FosB isoform X2 [Plodia interpunctella]|uniref:protein FosB isoform X2 n=1 Tax=Plodia interpunctella TaxID=58824 RepID=UPI002368E2F6|nr:protein FosB isoform X2 [Plodia interpunctella]
MTMKLEISDTQSNHSDFSCDSQSSQGSSTNDFVSSVPTSRALLTLANLEGLQSGVPTRTTATITPTQLRNFEQTYIELSNCRGDQNNHVGFVPPSVSHANNYGILNNAGYCESANTALHVSPGPASSGDSSSSPGLPAPKRRNMGGRRPAKTPQDLSPEEEERRKIRRERNKMAAARCRKRRLDHTNELQDETDKLEEKKQSLQEEIRQLNASRQKLETILQNHLQSCRLKNNRSVSPADVKPFQPYQYADAPEDGIRVKVENMEPTVDLGLSDSDLFSPNPDQKIMLSAANPVVCGSPPPPALSTPPAPPAAPARPARPSFLQVPAHAAHATQCALGQAQKLKILANNNSVPGVEISTPSNGIPFNFDSLMEGGTGLTPVHPHPHVCSQQTRAAPDAASPDGLNSLVSL